MDIMDSRRSKLLCNNTMQMYIKHISLVRYMIVLSCAKGSSYIRKKISHIINKWCQFTFPLFDLPTTTTTTSARHLSRALADCFIIEIPSLLAHGSWRACADYVLNCIFVTEFPARDTQSLFSLWPGSFIDRKHGSY